MADLEKSTPLRVALSCLMVAVVAAFSVWLWVNGLEPLAVIGGFVCLAGVVLTCRGLMGR